MRVVVALGGNMILQKNDEGTFNQQFSRIRQSAKILAEIAANGNELVVTHGNGPQVGNLLIQQERAEPDVPAQPLSILDAMTQGQIGVMLELAMINAFSERGISKKITVIPTLVEVDLADPAFDNPTKFIGPFYSEEEAKMLVQKGLGPIREQKGKGWRRVVASPIPQGIVESEIIESILLNNGVAIAVGGGGVPVVKKKTGYEFVNAVIDKDRASQVLASQIKADELVILTDVPHAYRNYGKANQEAIEEITASEAEVLLKNGEFGKGSMGPKVEACIAFVRNGGKKGIISDQEHALESVRGNAGTRIIPD